MRKLHDILQKSHGFGDPRMGNLGESLHVHMDSGLRGDFAVQVAAHAIRQHEQQSLVGIGIGNTILVVFAPADAAGLIDGKIHKV